MAKKKHKMSKNSAPGMANDGQGVIASMPSWIDWRDWKGISGGSRTRKFMEVFSPSKSSKLKRRWRRISSISNKMTTNKNM